MHSWIEVLQNCESIEYFLPICVSGCCSQTHSGCKLTIPWGLDNLLQKTGRFLVFSVQEKNVLDLFFAWYLHLLCEKMEYNIFINIE